MASLFSPTSPQNPPQQTFLDKKPPLMPRQSTSDVLSFTHIIADRLLPDQNVWDYFSPPPAPATSAASLSEGTTRSNNNNNATVNAALPPLSPTSPGPQGVSMATMMMSPTSPMSPTFGQFSEESSGGTEGYGRTSTATGSLSSKRNSITSSIMQERTGHNWTNTFECSSDSISFDNNNNHKADPSLPPMSNNIASSPASPSSPSTTTEAIADLAPVPPPPQATPSTTAWSTAASATTTFSATASTNGGNGNGDSGGNNAAAMETPKLHKRRSFAQSLKHGMISLTQLLSPSSSAASSRLSSSMANSASTMNSSAAITGPPHYNILVLGSDSAPLASTLYKMSGLLPSATKIRHYQEISGFFVAYFRSNGSFSCSPTMTPTTPTAPMMPVTARSSTSSASLSVEPAAASVMIEREGMDEVKSRRGSIQDSENDDLAETKTLSQPAEEGIDGVEGDEDPIMRLISARSSEETLLQLKISSGGHGGKGDEMSSSGGSTAHSVADMDREEILLNDDEGSAAAEGDDSELETETKEPTNASANASLSVHAFSLDTTWPVPRTLAQTFWFPHAHGIIYIVDATRKNDPRGIDHLLNARQFLASLIADPHFKRKDIPVVVFANKAGLDPETCYRVDEIAEILGCEDWDLGSGSDSEGKGRRSSGEVAPSSARTRKGLVEGGLVEVDASGAIKTRPWCVKSTRCDGAGDGLRESVEWLKSRMGETWRP
ncbi:hypothetical protein BKA57DRAFT_431718 [Linnemannia elongata]|nr:hypothetical protein BKA57DRAFT_431718 [Linnemannia elongata]